MLTSAGGMGREQGVSTVMAIARVLVVAGVALGGGLLWRAQHAPAPLAPVSQVTIAVPTQINSATMIVAHSQGLFKKATVEVVTQPFVLGKDALNSVLEGKADLAVVADTPFIHAVLGGKDVVAVAAISQARRALALVARSDRGISTVKDLTGKSVGLTAGTNLSFFLDAMLGAHRVAVESVKVQDLKVEATVAALKAGTLDAAVMFEPHIARLQASMPNAFKVFYGEDVYAFRFMLVGKPGYIDGHPEEVQRILRALLAASDWMRDNPLLARSVVGAAVGVDDASMARLFDPSGYIVSLDQAMLLALDEQTRWAMKRGLVATAPVPNYLKSLRYTHLEAVSPAAVKLVR
jgi:ABC-type nitrate/sulfonate/bicarbonate transport system substrate-binding protein